MVGSGKVVVIALWAVILGEAVAIAAWYGAIPGFEDRAAQAALDAAGVVLLIGAVSVGIERAIEYLWTITALAVGSFWPVTAVGAFVNGLSDDVGEAVTPHITQAQAIVKGLEDAAAITDATATTLNGQLQDATAQLGKLKEAVKHAQGALTFASAAADVANNVSVQFQALVDGAHGAAITSEERFALAASIVRATASLDARRANPEGRQGADLDTFAAGRAEAAFVAWSTALPADLVDRDTAVREYLHKNPFARFGDASAALTTSITSVTDFLASFKDNPGRRMLSLELGIIGGLAVALFTGVDVFAGTANEGAAAADVVSASVGGILFTGVLMGLGSSPTHEVIRVLQELKQARKKAGTPDVDPASQGAGGAVAGAAAMILGGGGGLEGVGGAEPEIMESPRLAPRAPRAMIRMR